MRNIKYTVSVKIPRYETKAERNHLIKEMKNKLRQGIYSLLFYVTSVKVNQGVKDKQSSKLERIKK